MPIVHVNADDPEAALSAVRLALAYRDGVRPRLRDRPRRVPPVRPQRAGRRVVHAAADGRAHPEAADRSGGLRLAARRGGRDHGRGGRGIRRRRDLDAPRARTSSSGRRSAIRPRHPPPVARPAPTATTGDAVVTAVAADRLRSLNEQLLSVPAGFTINAKLAKQLERRHETIDGRRHRLGSGRRLSPTPPCSRTAFPCASRVRTPSAAPSPTGTSCSTTRTPERRTRRSSTCRGPAPPSRSTTRRSPSTRRSASSTATRWQHRTRSCSGRRSSATSSTAPRS